jgi:hypothetical protein
MMLTRKDKNKLFTYRPKVDYIIEMNWITNAITQIIQTHWNAFALSGYFSDFWSE